MMDHLIVNGLASPVSLSPCHPALGAKAPGPTAVEGAERLTSGLGREVNLWLEKVSLVPPSSLSPAHTPAALFQVGQTSPHSVQSQIHSPPWLMGTLGTGGVCNSPFTGSPCHRPFATNPLAVANLVWFDMVWCGLEQFGLMWIGTILV